MKSQAVISFTRFIFSLTGLLCLSACDSDVMESPISFSLISSISVEGGFATAWLDGEWIAPFHVVGDFPKIPGYITKNVRSYPESDFVVFETLPPAPLSGLWTNYCDFSEDFYKQDRSVLRFRQSGVSVPIFSNLSLWSFNGETSRGESGQAVTQNDKICGILLGGVVDNLVLVLPFDQIKDHISEHKN